MNPFEQKLKVSRPGTYMAYVEETVANMAVNESKKTDTRKADITKFRMSLNKIGIKTDKRFNTLLDYDGNLWIKRVS